MWGVPGDGPLDAVHARLRALGAQLLLLDQREAGHHDADGRVEAMRYRVVIEDTRSGRLQDLDAVRAAYLRPIETSTVLATKSMDDARRIRAEHLDRVLTIWSDVTDAAVVNPPDAMAANSSKPYQLRLIHALGFEVPETLVTTDADVVRAFAVRHGKLIYKSVSGVRSIVHPLDDEAMERLDDVANVPTQFQQYVPGVDVRVHVVGEAVFATEVRSTASDYRYASLTGDDVTMAAIDIPDALAERCCRMAAAMRLTVAGIDLRRTPEGRWVCFEVNPSPAFVYYEEATGQPIGDAIARWLMQADEGQENNPV